MYRDIEVIKCLIETSHLHLELPPVDVRVVVLRVLLDGLAELRGRVLGGQGRHARWLTI